MVNGVEICAVNSGHSLAFVKMLPLKSAGLNVIRMALNSVPAIFFQSHLEKLLKRLLDLGEDMHDCIPDFPHDVVCYTDGYGNLKCSMDPDALPHVKNKTFDFRY